MAIVSLKLKQSFLDRPKIMRQIDKAKRQNLMRAGGAMRLTAKRSMRKRLGPSKPGTPPHAHVGTLRRLIFFSFDKTTKTVVVGPYALPGRGFAPKALEYGGVSFSITSAKKRRAMQATPKQLELLKHYGLDTQVNKFQAARMIDQLAANKWRKSTRVRTKKRDRLAPRQVTPDGKMKRRVRVVVAARPYMKPAMLKNLDKVSKVWRNSVRRGT